MWFTLLVMAVAVSLEPFRIGMSVVMLNRPRPHLQLAAFLCGGFVMGLSVGAVVLFALESHIPASAHFTLPRVQIVIGALALAAAAILAVTRGRRDRTVPAWLSSLLD
ncbi:MAG: GAP family protein, partial [Mycolicibacterium aromaticivorans]|nr:GAP family protein [Mycolicibacterium aromaticivorans]